MKRRINGKKEKRPIHCYFCKNKPTHTVLLELREKPGPPIKENNVVALVCDIHSIDNSFERWVPLSAFHKLVNDYRKEGININRQYCSIQILKLK